MGRRDRRGLELAARIEEQADNLLVKGATGPMVADILREYAHQIRSAENPDRITETMWYGEVKKLMTDLQIAMGFVERW